MECLLDDSVNSNLPSSCLSCREMPPGPGSSGHTCQQTIRRDATNRNSITPVTHNDIVVSTPDATPHPGRCYDSSLRPCLPGHVPSLVCPECDAPLIECRRSTVSGEGGPAPLPGSPNPVSGPPGDERHQEDTEGSHLKLTDTAAGRCSRCGRLSGANLNSLCSPPHRSRSNTSPSPPSPLRNQHDVVSASSNNQHDAVSASSNNQRDAMSTSSNNQHDAMSTLSNNQHDAMSASSNSQHDVVSAPANNQHDIVAAPPSPIPVGHSRCNQNETASTASWGRHRGQDKTPSSRSHLHLRDIDIFKSDLSKTPSSRSHLDLHLRDIDIFKSDLRALRSSMEDTQYYPSSPRATLLGHGSGSRVRSSLDTRSPLTGHRSRRTLPGSVGRTLRQSLRGAEDADGDTAMEGQRQLTPLRPLTPSRPLTPLPQELLYELHDLDHENEDLSAEVVHSLNLRNYDIKQVLGKGISSTVRRVVEKTTGQEFAVKIIDISGEKGEVAQVEQTKKDTYREIRILRMCGGHPNIIELHDVFETPTFIFLVFEICKKGELFDYLTSVVSLSEKRTRIFMRQLLEAVEFFHRKNIVHRDLKPENILLDDNLNIKVSDFGFATVVEPGEELVELCGTPGYLAPEVLAHSMYENVSGYGKEVDMWACGVIMYTLLCGAPPFWNRRQMMMLRAIMNADYTFNSPEWDDISDPPKNLIQKLLLVNPQQRLTAKEALAHPFFHSMFAEEKKFDARRKFRAGVFCVVFYLRLNFSYKHPPPISMDTVRSNPYGIKVLRKVIDSCAFGMYRHWVKRVDNQNRAALFEHTLRDDWKHSLMTEHGIMA